MSRLVELNHVVEHGVDAYPGLPAPVVRPHLTHDESRPNYDHQAEFTITAMELVGNVGTYLDAPWHRHRDRGDIASIPLERVADLDGVVIDVAPDDRAVHVTDLGEVAGKAVLFRSGWSARRGSSDYWEPGPYLADDTIDALVAARPGLVGVDFWNVDAGEDKARPAHTRLLGADILIVEHLAQLDELPTSGFRFTAAPLRVAGAASMPVRAYARIGSGF